MKKIGWSSRIAGSLLLAFFGALIASAFLNMGEAAILGFPLLFLIFFVVAIIVLSLIGRKG